AALDVVLQAPVLAVEIGDDLRPQVTAVQAHRRGQVAAGVGVQPLGPLLVQVGRAHADSPLDCVFRPWTSESNFSSVIRTHIYLLLTISTGESPHAPMHSPSTRVNRPSGVVSR